MPAEASPSTAAPEHSGEPRPWRAGRDSGKTKALVKTFSHTLRKQGSSLAWRARWGQNESNCMESSDGHSMPISDEIRYGMGGGRQGYNKVSGMTVCFPHNPDSHTLDPASEDRAGPHFPIPHRNLLASSRAERAKEQSD